MSKKGITLTALAITIIVLLILTSTVVISGVNIRNSEKKTRFASELSYVQEMVDSYYNSHNEYPILQETVNLYVSSMDKYALVQQFDTEIRDNDHYVMYKIDFSLLSNSDRYYGNNYLNNGLDYYVFSKDTLKVYYANGVKIGGKQYFTLTEDLKKSINYTDKNNLNDGIIFGSSNISWDINTIINVKVPVRYTSVKVKLNNEEKAKTSTDGAYNIYKIIVDTNSTITVEYKRKANEQIKMVSYDVKNIDKESPTFELSQLNQIYDNNKILKYIKIDKKKDNLSGVKLVKYANLKVEANDAKEYFENKGIKINEDVITVDNENIEYVTVYMEDNAGNYTSKYIQIKGV